MRILRRLPRSEGGLLESGIQVKILEDMSRGKKGNRHMLTVFATQRLQC